MSTKASGMKWGIGIVVVALLLLAGYLVLKHRRQAMAPATATASSAPAPASTLPPPEQHPIAQAQVNPAQASTAPLPALDHSDTMVRDALSRLAGRNVNGLLVKKALIPRMVATINALTGKSLPENILPVHDPRGMFRVSKLNGHAVIAPATLDRYSPYVVPFEQADTQSMVAWYVHNYPLFEQAWKQLGYPQKSFNDRLVAVIDHLLATPDLQHAPDLVAVSGVYQFSDPGLENRSIGQKLLLRLGPAQEAKVKSRLRAIRDAITGQQQPAEPTSSSNVPGAD
ncbi:DUF3014 domain-containing protein [Oleiagrimonas sp.]|jgi:hypothetical protein|uniref:DUF3014 domain-containing protein n=1 Tax=Oleiagrimonas sp. TaxID=2010330 RepID=UPI00261E48DF|nr:DUF3014 domain-containing protein [Oleiagrimonas sp.]MDA3913799.1 DUF3014 domain-containing protein [Oleiagrimonas sp.]